jgi:hypothetical protein
MAEINKSPAGRTEQIDGKQKHKHECRENEETQFLEATLPIGLAGQWLSQARIAAAIALSHSLCAQWGRR